MSLPFACSVVGSLWATLALPLDFDWQLNAVRASEAAAVRIEDYAVTRRGYRVLQPVRNGDKPATMPLDDQRARRPSH